jgi:hypothetical protein
MTVWRMRVACWIPEAINTHTEYAKLIASPRLQWLHKRYTYIACLAVCEVALISANCRAVYDKCLETLINLAKFEIVTAAPMMFQVFREVKPFTSGHGVTCQKTGTFKFRPPPQAPCYTHFFATLKCSTQK